MTKGAQMTDILNRISENVVIGSQDQVRELTEQAVAEGMPPEEILKKGLIPGMDIVGEKFQIGEYFIPHMLLAARAMQAALGILRPLLASSGAEPVGRVVLGTVEGDHHDIGKNLLKMMLEGKGFEVNDLGIDVTAETFVAAVDEKVQIVAMSALLSTTAPFLVKTIDALKAAGVRDRVKIMVGGGVVTQEMADQIGADAFGQDAAVGAEKALELLGA
jgi:5-methyltetrahydrofolate--homocysteine methyltransferase